MPNADHVRATVQLAVMPASQAAWSLATLFTAPSRRKNSSLRYEGRSSLAALGFSILFGAGGIYPFDPTGGVGWSGFQFGSSIASIACAWRPSAGDPVKDVRSGALAEVVGIFSIVFRHVVADHVDRLHSFPRRMISNRI